MDDPSSIQERAARIRLVLMDCDGVLTDGRIWILENGEDQKAFNSRDGLGLDLLHRAGLSSGIISGRRSAAVERRARALGMEYLRLACVDKAKAFEEIATEAGVSNLEVAFVGDDLNDIPPMSRSGLAIAVANAAMETIAKANYVTKANGGHGAIREVVELILKTQDRWEDVIAGFLR